MAIASTSSSCSRMRPRSGPAIRRYHHGLPLMPPLNPTALSLVKALINLSQEVLCSSIASSCPCQKRNIAAMARRVKILLMMFEEIKDAGTVLPPSALLCFSQLHVVVQRVKLLMDDCADSSRIWLLMEHQRLSTEFHDLTQEMAAALEILPLSLLDVSCDVREQVELLRAQAKKAKLYVDPGEAELWTEVQSVMAAFEKKETPDATRLAKIFGRLELKDAKDCQREVERMQEEVEVEEEEGGPKARLMRVCFNDMVSFVRYCKCVLYGVTEMETEEASEEFTAEEEDDDEVKVPDDFRCPISLELMGDPVIVSTGQTYERAAISTWIESGHQTCPKSGQRLAHKTLVPNYALRNVIRQWCLRHNVRLKPPEPPIRASDIASPPTAAAMEATKLTAEFLLRELPAATPDARRHIAGELRLLAKSGSNNRKLVAEVGAIPALIPLLTSGDGRTQEHAVTAILNLSIYAPNKALIVEAGAVEPLIGLVQAGGSESEVARENAAAALFSLSHVADYAALLGGRPEAIEGLLDLLRGGSHRGRRDAASALFNMAIYHPNRPALVAAGAVAVLMDSLSPSGAGLLTDETLAVLAVLAGCREGLLALAARPYAVAHLVALLHTASPKGKENASSVLLQLCRHGGDPFVQGLLCDQPSVLPCLRSLLSTGTPRATRKATCLLRIFHRFSSHQRSIASDLQQQQHRHQHDATTLAH